MKKYKSLIVTSLVLSVILLSPVVSFAQEGGDNGKVEQHSNVQMGGNNNRGSFFNRFFGWFGRGQNKNVDNSSSNSNSLAPNILGIKAPTVLKVGQVGTWTVTANDPKNGSLDYSVDWGDTSVNPLASMVQPLGQQTSTFTHTYASAGKYKITFTVTNDAGLDTVSTVTVRVIGTDTTTAPVISNFTATSTRPHRATLTWNTDVKSNSQVWFSKTTPVVTTGTANITRNGKIINHRIILTGLVDNTQYYVVVKSTDSAGTTTSSEISFTTTITPVPVVDTTNPVISNIQTLSASTSGTISWTTDEPATSVVYYSTVTPLLVNAVTTISVVNASLVTSHSLNIPSLTSGTVYHFIIKSADASNNTAVSSEGSFITN